MPIEKWNIKNDFENQYFPKYPELLEIKKSIIQAGAKFVCLNEWKWFVYLWYFF